MNKKQILFLLLCVAGSLILITRQHCPQPVTQEAEQPEHAVASNTMPLPSEPQEELPPSNVSLPEPKPTDAQPSKRTITVKNNITKKMITYTKAFMKYTPEFTVTVNDVPIALGQQAEVPVENNSLIVGYTYNFLNGYRVGSRVTEFTIPQEKNEVELNFSWHNDWHFIIPGAQPEKIISQVD